MKVRAALDVIRPGLMADGGNVELLAIEADGTVRLTFQGTYSDCASASMTLQCVVEPFLRSEVLGVTAVRIG